MIQLTHLATATDPEEAVTFVLGKVAARMKERPDWTRTANVVVTESRDAKSGGIVYRARTTIVRPE